MKASGSSDTFVFLDPPYDIKDFLYGKNREMHKSFDHDRFADDVYNCVHKFMITYNVNDRLMELYKNYNLKEWKLHRTTPWLIGEIKELMRILKLNY